MNKYFLIVFLFGMTAFGSTTVSAQCDPATASPIKCSYYSEGYQDGATDARNNQSNDYRRYRNKYNGQYESFYRDGYQTGYNTITPSGGGRWTNSQKSAYDSGYSIGQSDRRRNNQGRAAANNNGGYDQNIGLYFQQGYNDGFANRSKRYDVALGDIPNPYPTPNPNYPPPFPGGGGATGTAYWAGRVDDRANIVIRGNTINAENGGGNGIQTYSQIINGSMRRGSIVSARLRDGRGSVSVIQQPDRSNGFAAIVQVYDPKGGASDYKVDISWSGGANVEEPYSSGRVTWRGRVDQTARIIISGSDVQTQDASGTGISAVTFNINGYLANRPGIVNVKKKNGRGTVNIVQQPMFNNNFEAIVQIFDPKGGDDDYEIEITW
ncbi:hypothetical protein BH10ACI2_BH10ACI2_06140 [soil metagenome]